MWLLLAREKHVLTDTGDKFYRRLRPGVRYKIREREADKSADCIMIDVKHWADVENGKSRPEVTLISNGLQVKIDNQLNDLEEPTLFNGQCFSIEGGDTIYKLHWYNLTVMHEKQLDPEGHQKLLEAGMKYGFHVEKNINNAVTHYYASKRILEQAVKEPSRKFMTALPLMRVQFVNDSFFDVMDRSDKIANPSNINADCETVVVEAFGPLKRKTKFIPMKKRHKLFKGYHFYFCDKQQCMEYRSIIKLAGGVAEYMSYEDAVNASFTRKTLLVSPPEETVEFLPVKAKYYQELDVERCIDQKEIDFAIIYCSMDFMCNLDIEPFEIDKFAEDATPDSPEVAVKAEPIDDTPTIPYDHEANDEPSTARFNYEEYANSVSGTDADGTPTVPYLFDDDEAKIEVKEEPTEDTTNALHNEHQVVIHSDTETEEGEDNDDDVEEPRAESTEPKEDRPTESTIDVEQHRDKNAEPRNDQPAESAMFVDHQSIPSSTNSSINQISESATDENGNHTVGWEEEEEEFTPQMVDVGNIFDTMFAKSNSQIEQKRKERELKRKREDEIERQVALDVEREERERKERLAERLRQQQKDAEQNRARDNLENADVGMPTEVDSNIDEDVSEDVPEASKSPTNDNTETNEQPDTNHEKDSEEITELNGEGVYGAVVFAPLVVKRRPQSAIAAAERSEDGRAVVNYKRFKKVRHSKEQTGAVYSWTDTVSSSQVHRNRMNGIGQSQFSEMRLNFADIDEDMIIRPARLGNRRIRNI